MKAHVDDKAALEIRLEALRKAQPDFEAFNKAVVAAENIIITALKDCMAAEQKRGWLSGFFSAGRETQQFRLIKDKHIQRLADWERELVQKWPNAYSDIKRHPQNRWDEHWSYYVGWRDLKDQGLKFLLYDVNADISLCEM
jgi:hypothetical protein